MLIVNQIENTHFSKTEREIVDYIIDQGMNIEKMSANEIARNTFTSAPLLVRIAKKLGYSGFNEFKSAYLKELAYKQQTINQIISPKRGNIYDSTGKALAISAQVDTITINPNKIKKDSDEDTKALKEKIEGITLEFVLKSGKDGKTFGSVSTKHIVEQLREKYDIRVDKRKFINAHPIGALGYSNLKVELYKGVIATIRVHLSEK